MNEKVVEKCINVNLASNLVSGVFFAATGPTIHAYMISHVSVDFFKTICFINEALGCLVFFVLDRKDKDGKPIMIHRLRRHFILVSIMGVLGFTAANISGMFDVELRFILIAFLQGIFTCMWKQAMNDAWNLTLKGTRLTIFNVKVSKLDRVGAITGSFVILLFSMPVEVALTIQIVAYIYLAISDIYIYKKLKSEGIYNLNDIL